MPHISTSVRSVGIDTLTCSGKEDSKGPYLRALGATLLMRSAQKGNRVAYFKRAVYTGVQTKSVGVGSWHDRSMVELRGEDARDWGPLLLPWTDSVSRLDVQVTVHMEPYWQYLAYECWLDAIERAKAEGRPPKYQLQADPTTGHTLYIGRKSSRFQARLYEKGREEPGGGWENCWRYEVQARRERASQVALELGRSTEPESWIARSVAGHFSARGVQPIYSEADPLHLAPLPPEETDTAKSLRWLGQGVAPVIRRLYDAGSYDQALKALGIGETLERP